MRKRKHFRTERHEEILRILADRGAVDVSELASIFGVSEISIRKDLNYLHDQGKLERKHGGAHSARTGVTERPLTEKQKLNLSQKRGICRAARELISNGDSIMLDAGTTAESIPSYLNGLDDLTVITNGINLIQRLMGFSFVRVYTVGGWVDAKSFSILGEQAEASLRQFNAQLSFITADGLSVDLGATNNSLQATNISKILIENSVKRVLLADSTKVTKTGVFSLCAWTDIDVWITDSGVDESFRSRIERVGVEVVLAQPIE